MITNILASIVVTLVTNTTETPLEYIGEKSRICFLSSNWNHLCWQPYSQCKFYSDAQVSRKRVTTVVTRNTTYSFTHDGMVVKFDTNLVVSRSEKIMMRQPEWVEDPRILNILVGDLICNTNIIIYTNNMRGVLLEATNSNALTVASNLLLKEFGSGDWSSLEPAINMNVTGDEKLDRLLEDLAWWDNDRRGVKQPEVLKRVREWREHQDRLRERTNRVHKPN